VALRGSQHATAKKVFMRLSCIGKMGKNIGLFQPFWMRPSPTISCH